MHILQNRLIAAGLSEWSARQASMLIATAIILLLALLADMAAKKLILKGIARIVRKSANRWDDIFLENHVFDRLSRLAPAIVVYLLVPLFFLSSPRLVSMVERLAVAYMLVIGMLAVLAALDAALDIYRRFDVSRERPIRGYIQAVKLIVFFAFAILAISALLDRSPTILLGGLGALTAVLILVFKDTILGFVASVQLSANQMVRRGDWISMPKFDTDGDVIDITLTTVKVRNWDKTISTIPTYALISNAFRNWRGMEESGGRRIKRPINIDMNTIRFCDDAMIERSRKIEILRPYLDRKLEEVAAHNAAHNIDRSVEANGRALTNVGTFRAYIEAYLHANPLIHDDMTFLVRQLAPTDKGLPLEIYVFSKDQVWANYEAIQADIFDHLLAVLPVFDLKVHQTPSGSDLAALSPVLGPPDGRITPPPPGDSRGKHGGHP